MQDILKRELEPHQFRQLVNELKEISLKYHGHQSLRERISLTLSKYIQIK